MSTKKTPLRRSGNADPVTHQTESIADQISRLEAEASEADADTEDLLRQLDEVARRRRPDKQLEERYLALRDQLVPRLRSSGPRYYLDADHVKRYAFVVQPEPIEVTISELEEAVERGEMTAEVLNRVAPQSRRVNKEEFKKAVAEQEDPPQRRRACRPGDQGHPHVRFATPQEEDEE